MSYTSQVIPYVRFVLRRIEDALASKEEWFPFSNKSTDGRTNSCVSEPLVTEFLLTYPSLSGVVVRKQGKKSKKGKKAKKNVSTEEESTDEDNRAFGDIGIDISKFGYKEPFPCNIKIISDSTKSGCNSCGITRFIGYTFGKKCSSNNDVAKILLDIDRDGYDSCEPFLYGLILLSKEDKAYWVGTFDKLPAECITTNPANPLQIKFPTCKVSRTHKEYIRLIHDKTMESYHKRAEPSLIYKEGKRESARLEARISI